MEIDFGKLIICNVILHEVPRHRRREEGGSPILSEIESPLSEELKVFFREKL